MGVAEWGGEQGRRGEGEREGGGGERQHRRGSPHTTVMSHPFLALILVCAVSTRWVGRYDCPLPGGEGAPTGQCQAGIRQPGRRKAAGGALPPAHMHSSRALAQIRFLPPLQNHQRGRHAGGEA